MKCKHGIETTSGVCGLCKLEEDGALHKAINVRKDPPLNPWFIETEQFSNGEANITLNLIDGSSGEIRQIRLSVDDISAIIVSGIERIKAVAATVNDDDVSLLDGILRIYHNKEATDDRS